MSAEAAAWIEKGNARHRQGDVAGAIACYEAAIEADPDCARAHYNLGVLEQDAGRSEAAMARYERALDADPRYLSALINLGNVLRERGEGKRAAGLYRRALEVDPQSESARYNAGLMALMGHDFEAGWEGHELRFGFPPLAGTLAACSLPRATSVERGGRLAILKEQGVGDQLLFSTLLPEVAARGIDAVVEVDPRLLAAYRRSLPGLEFVRRARAAEAFAACDRQIPIGSLAAFLRRSVADFARQPRALLAPERARVEAIDAELPQGKRIGISWRSFRPGGGDWKSFPLATLAALEGAGATLVDLQYGDVAAERSAFDARHPGLRTEVARLDPFNDLEGLMAAIQACDLVVSASNVTAHLAGIIGKPAWLVHLGGIAPFHYWVPGADGRSLWYPSVEIMTDRSWGTWEQAFGAVAARWRAEHPS